MDVIIFNGFLGSGKTTAIENLITSLKSERLALVVNEFGKNSVDGKTLEKFNTFITNINNGSVFCSCKADKFVERMLEISELDIDTVVVESSGFSNPSSLNKILDFLHEKTNGTLALRAVITLICPIQYPKLSRTSVPYSNQIKVADVIIVNKIDLVSDEAIAEVCDKLKAENPDAKYFQSEYAKLDYSEIIDATKHTPKGMDTPNCRDLTATSLSIKLKDDIDLQLLISKIESCSESIHRLKGYINTSAGCKFVQLASGNISVEDHQSSDNIIVILFNLTRISKDEVKRIFCEFTED